MAENRTKNVKKNIIWGNIGNVVLMALSFISRTIFVYSLGAGLLGVNGLFTNILGVLSFSELGIGTAMNYSLYKPIANNEKETVKSLMRFYKKAYRIVAFIVALAGVLLLPFLDYLVNTDIPIKEIKIYYLVYLFNSVSSYFVTYKTAYIYAIQKNYIVTNINTIGQSVIYISQSIALLFHCNFLVYLLIQALVCLIQKIITVVYINFKFPLLTEKAALPVPEKTKNELWKNVKALIVHKIGDVSVHQTDNIIISAFISTTIAGLISNYTTLVNVISGFTNIIFNSFTASFGNLVVKETKEKQREIFDIYNFIGFWIYGFSTVAFITLTQSFITLWLGNGMTVDNLTMVLYYIAFYLSGMSFTVYNFKIAAGIFNEDKWLAFIQAVVNLVVSIAAVKIIGLPGVYIGTITQRIIVNIVRPVIVYKKALYVSPVKYFLEFMHRTILIVIIVVFMDFLSEYIKFSSRLVNFIVLAILTLVIPNLIILLVYGRTPMFKVMLDKIRR